MFNFIKKIFSPQGTREAIQNHFSRRYHKLKSKGEDPAGAIFEVMRLSYKINKIPFTDASLAYDAIPFMFMSFIDINNTLPDYLMYQMPNELARKAANIDAVARTIEESFSNPSCETNPNAKNITSDYGMIKEIFITALKYDVLWVRLLDKDIVQKIVNGPSTEQDRQEQTPNQGMDISEIDPKLDVNKFIKGLDLYGTKSKIIYALISNTLSILGRMPSNSFTLSDDCHLFLLGYIFGYSFKYSLFYEDSTTQEQMCWLTFGAVLEKTYGKATQSTKDNLDRVMNIMRNRPFPTYFEKGANAGEEDAIDFLLNIENPNRSRITGINNLYQFFSN